MTVAKETRLGTISLSNEVFAQIIFDGMMQESCIDRIWPSTLRGRQVGVIDRFTDSEFALYITAERDADERITLEFSVIGHGTGCYVRYIDVYHLQARKIEASYTTYGYEVYQDSGIQAYGSACYAADGVHIFRQLSPLAFDEAQNEFVPTGAVLDVFDYIIVEQGHLERRVNDDE